MFSRTICLFITTLCTLIPLAVSFSSQFASLLYFPFPSLPLTNPPTNPQITTPPMTTPVEKYKSIELYGGAFSLTVPERFVDISDYRPIPDHQEVYIDPDLDQSIIVELNSQVEIADSEAIVYVRHSLPVSIQLAGYFHSNCMLIKSRPLALLNDGVL